MTFVIVLLRIEWKGNKSQTTGLVTYWVLAGHQKPVDFSAKKQIEESCGIKIYAQKAMALCSFINAKFNCYKIHINLGQHDLEMLHLV